MAVKLNRKRPLLPENSKFFIFLVALSSIVLLLPSVSEAAHPLVTDDAGTQGKGNTQLELNLEYSKEDEKLLAEKAFEIDAIVSYGISGNADLVFAIPYVWIDVDEDAESVSDDGLSDIGLELKWRFYEKDGLSLAIKPGITLPTGDEVKGLGSGRVTYGLFFITTKEMQPWFLHLNLGYIRNENNTDEQKDIWHASVASELEVAKELKVVANIGMERNPDRTSNTHPAFLLGGLIYSVTENLDIDFGIKTGLNSPETDVSFLAGIAYRF